MVTGLPCKFGDFFMQNIFFIAEFLIAQYSRQETAFQLRFQKMQIFSALEIPRCKQLTP